MPSSLSDKVSNPDAKTIRAEAEKCGIDFKTAAGIFISPSFPSEASFPKAGMLYL